MEYVKGSPYFCDTKKRLKQYPYLDKDVSCEILIIGGGIDGAIANFYLSKKHDVMLVDKNKIGFGCTSCATALLEYQLDELAADLTKYLTKEQIVGAYKMGLSSIAKIHDFISEYGNECDFNLRPSFLYTDSIFSKKELIDEYNFRKENGFDCQLITQENNPFPFNVKAGIYSEKGGCEFNPYLFTKQMIENSSNQNKIFENTKIDKIESKQDHFIAITNYGYKIKCKKIILATGFNWEVLGLSDLCERFVSYSIVTKPIKGLSYYKKSLVHNMQSLYNYMRMLPDGGIIFGGEDVMWNIKKGIVAKQAEKKYKNLEKSLKKLFPNFIDKLEISHKFCGAFGTTNNKTYRK